jgi:hypothetical protein
VTCMARQRITRPRRPPSSKAGCGPACRPRAP